MVFYLNFQYCFITKVLKFYENLSFGSLCVGTSYIYSIFKIQKTY